MKREILLIATLMLTVLISNIAFSHEIEKMRSVEEVINSILVRQNISTTDEIDCSKISDSEFEELGDSMMERMAGNHELHEQMDVMMGGEGSESLRQMHIVMGRNWLGCIDSQGMMGSSGMMDGMMMPMMGRMMGNYYPAYYTSYDTLLSFTIAGWGLFIILIIALLVFLITGRIKIQKRRK